MVCILLYLPLMCPLSLFIYLIKLDVSLFLKEKSGIKQSLALLFKVTSVGKITKFDITGGRIGRYSNVN